jgi:hypothetical protein
MNVMDTLMNQIQESSREGYAQFTARHSTQDSQPARASDTQMAYSLQLTAALDTYRHGISELSSALSD